MSRQVADASQLTDEDLGLANVILTNGARLYVDHAHPEYSSPEVTSPLAVVRWEKAGEQVMLDASRMAAQAPGSTPILLYKNNTDNKGASYGAHENYLMRRSTPFAEIVRHLTPFFVSRQVVCGAGRVGIGQDGRDTTPERGFQISQRADYFEVEVGLETTLKRPIINTRDEPHADPALYRRLHVIIGDANLAEISIYLKVGTTSLVLAMIEDGFIDTDFTVDGAVRALRDVSHDPTLRQLITLRDGRRLTAVQLQLEYLDLARKFVEDRYGSDADAQTVDVLERWESVLPASSVTRWSAPRSWTGWPSSSCSRSIATVTAWTGTTPSCTSSTCSTPTSVPTRASTSSSRPPVASSGCSTTRPSRPRCTTRPRTPAPTSGAGASTKYAASVAAASWDSVIFDLPGRESLQRVPTIDPLRGSKAHVGELIDRCASAEELVAAITR